MNTQMLLPLSLMSSMALPMMAQNVNTENQKPDVLFLFVDDMTYNGLNELGTSDVISPKTMEKHPLKLKSLNY